MSILYFVGLSLNMILVMLLLAVMIFPGFIQSVLFKGEQILMYFKVWEPSDSRRSRINDFISGYQETVDFLKSHKQIIIILFIGTFLQRFSVFALTYVVYRGLGLSGFGMTEIILLQAAIYVAVDMLPIPGAQGITEAMYKGTFGNIFTGQYLVASMCITRGISFYLVMVISFGIWGFLHLRKH